MKKLIALLFFLVLPLVGNAAIFGTPAQKLILVPNANILPGPEHTKDGESYVIEKFFPGITNISVVMLLAISTVFIIIAGMFYLFSSGDSEMTKRAKEIIIWTIMGVTIAILSYTIVKLLTGIHWFS